MASRFEDVTFGIPTLVLPRLSSYGQRFAGVPCSWPFLDRLKLAVPDFLGSGIIELLLGADTFSLLVWDDLCRGEPGEPIALNNTLGWIVSGAVRRLRPLPRVMTHQCSVDDDLAVSMRCF